MSGAWPLILIAVFWLGLLLLALGELRATQRLAAASKQQHQAGQKLLSSLAD